MKRLLSFFGYGVLFMFFIQSAATLVESVYILELLNTSLDEKVLGVLFFFSPVLLLVLDKRISPWLIWLIFGLLVLGRLSLPYLGTTGRMLASGTATGAALLLIPLLLARRESSRGLIAGLAPAVGLALAVSASVLLRTVNYTLDYSLAAEGTWIVVGLSLLLAAWLATGEQNPPPASARTRLGVTSAAVGIMAVLSLMYFVFSSPGVVARWTEGSYAAIVLVVALLTAATVFILLQFPRLLDGLPAWLVRSWNALFTVALAGTILAHRVAFPASPDAPVAVVGPPGWLQQVPLWAMLLLFPVLYLDFAYFAGRLNRSGATPRQLALGFFLGALLLVVLIFMQIFSNVWGYVEPVSFYFRNQFWLPFALAAGVVTVLVLPLSDQHDPELPEPLSRRELIWPALATVLLLLGTTAGVWWTQRRLQPGPQKNRLVVMTYNIQQANDQDGQKSYWQQLDLIREVQPDLLGLQESDAARISLGNNDYVRYYAGKLGYYSYYGPKTVTGTYGTALLSRYPLINPRHFFTYSDQDEIGSVEAEIEIGERRIAVFNVHPDGSDAAMLAFARGLLDRAGAYDTVIAVGDYNLRQGEAAFEVIDLAYKNAWLEADTPGEVQGDDASPMDGWIDHIFLSTDLLALAPTYRLPPASATDHPALWATIAWPEQ